MDVLVYATRCAVGEEHLQAYQLLSTVVQRAYGISALQNIARESGGKPYFPDCPDICFNLSHSYGAVACAVHDRPVGVDIERLRPAPKRLADGMEDIAFFYRWTAKEATVKRDGKGIGALIRDFDPVPLCQSSAEILPGWIVTVCPSEKAEVRFFRFED